jgi:FAD/FMN-containing dehydrogenase
LTTDARDLTNGSVATAPACLQLAPVPAVVADLLHDESRTMAAGVASAAQPGTLDELRMVLRWHAAHGHRITVSGARTGVVGALFRTRRRTSSQSRGCEAWSKSI